MKKSKAMSIIIIIVISLLLIYLLSNILLNTKGSVNQGNFRVNDFVIRSSLDVEEITSQEQTNNGFESMTLNLSQRNNFSFLVAKQIGISDIYIDNISISNPINKGEVILYQNGEEDELIPLDSEKVTIYPEEKEGQILINFNVDNVDFLKDVKLPDGTNSVTFDGSMLKLLDIKLSDLQIDVNFNINIIDETGKLNVCKISLKVPEEELINSGVSIKRQNLENYKFSIEDSVLKKIIDRF